MAITTTVVNIVASVNIHSKIPLEKASAELINTEYQPEQFPGLVLRLKDPKVSALLFSSGKIVCTGARTIPIVHEAVQKIIKEISTIGVKVTKEPDIEIQNMVASGDLGLKLNLNELAFQLESSEYEPEQFPGLVYKVPNSRVTILLFGTGKIVCTGAKNEREIKKTVKELYKTLIDLKKK
ncbi:MAG: TATA-box-binding protein [Nanoarchaeota archaeon]|nr:TATA-box-binding protein [Nanoarchaeota archaeon]